MEVLFFHRYNLTPHTPVTDAMTSDDSSMCKNREFSGTIQRIAVKPDISPNWRTPIPYLSARMGSSRAPGADIGTWRTKKPATGILWRVDVRQFGGEAKKAGWGLI
jgi:hypothetical protein